MPRKKRIIRKDRKCSTFVFIHIFYNEMRFEYYTYDINLDVEQRLLLYVCYRERFVLGLNLSRFEC